MANLHKYTSTEALNISYSSDFKIQAAWSISSSEVTKDVSGYHTVFLQTDEDIYIMDFLIVLMIYLVQQLIIYTSRVEILFTN